MENNALISDQEEVCNVLNDFYVNTAKEIGINSQTNVGENHPSILAIRQIVLKRAIQHLILSRLIKRWSQKKKKKKKKKKKTN